MATTTTVRIAVAKFEFTPSIPILANIEVKAANIADSKANTNHMLDLPNSVSTNLILYKDFRISFALFP